METKSKILIVDDTADTVELLQKRFQAEGYATAVAYDGEEGLQKVATEHPDLIVLDVMMPKLDGFKVCERLRKDENTRYIPILMLTAKSEMPNKIKGLDIGADDYISKPFNYKEVSARVKSLLAKKDAVNNLLEEEKTGALGKMLDEVAHEVRNPLVAIGGFARRIHKNLPEGDKNREYAEIILNNVEALEKMVQQLFAVKSASFSYIESCDINEIVQTAITMFNREIKGNNITVKTHLLEPSPTIPADQGNLTIAISRLVENAIESMKGEKRVLDISTATNDRHIKIQIADTGQGLSREAMKSIYDPFFSSKIYGPGLGLTFVLKTIRNHNGTISVESEEGRGACFTIKLPVVREQRPGQTE